MRLVKTSLVSEMLLVNSIGKRVLFEIQSRGAIREKPCETLYFRLKTEPFLVFFGNKVCVQPNDKIENSNFRMFEIISN